MENLLTNIAPAFFYVTLPFNILPAIIMIWRAKRAKNHRAIFRGKLVIVISILWLVIMSFGRDLEFPNIGRGIFYIIGVLILMAFAILSPKNPNKK